MYCDQRVCLSLCPPRISQKPHDQTSRNFPLIVAVPRSSSVDNAVYFRFCADVMFSHNAANGAQSETALCFV